MYDFHTSLPREEHERIDSPLPTKATFVSRVRQQQ